MKKVDLSLANLTLATQLENYSPEETAYYIKVNQLFIDLTRYMTDLTEQDIGRYFKIEEISSCAGKEDCGTYIAGNCPGYTYTTRDFDSQNATDTELCMDKNYIELYKETVNEMSFVLDSTKHKSKRKVFRVNGEEIEIKDSKKSKENIDKELEVILEDI